MATDKNRMAPVIQPLDGAGLNNFHYLKGKDKATGKRAKTSLFF
jgi:hypothetical protein